MHDEGHKVMTIKQVRNGTLTAEEWAQIQQRVRRSAFASVAIELGYRADHVSFLKFTEGELEKRVVSGIRELRAKINDLERELRKLKKENEKRAQIMFDFFTNQSDSQEKINNEQK